MFALLCYGYICLITMSAVASVFVLKLIKNLCGEDNTKHVQNKQMEISCRPKQIVLLRAWSFKVLLEL